MRSDRELYSRTKWSNRSRSAVSSLRSLKARKRLRLSLSGSRKETRMACLMFASYKSALSEPRFLSMSGSACEVDTSRSPG